MAEQPRLPIPGFLKPESFEEIGNIPVTLDALMERERLRRQQRAQNALAPGGDIANRLAALSPSRQDQVTSGADGLSPELQRLAQDFMEQKRRQREAEDSQITARRKDAEIKDFTIKQKAAQTERIEADVAEAKQKAENVAAKLTPGEKKVDEKFAQVFVDWKAAGGFADVKKNLEQLEDAAKQLSQTESATGPIVGNIPDALRGFTEKGRSAVDLRERVEEVVQRNLRVILGAQFTEKEGERLISRAFNPRLQEKQNAKRLRALISSMRSMAAAKEEAAEYFRENGTLSGFKGKTEFSTADIEGSLDSLGDGSKVRVKDPDTGVTAVIPIENLEKAKKRGLVEVD